VSTLLLLCLLCVSEVMLLSFYACVMPAGEHDGL
jgi:hypothetical protein